MSVYIIYTEACLPYNPTLNTQPLTVKRFCDFQTLISVINLVEGNVTTIQSQHHPSNTLPNTYSFLDVQAPLGFIVSVLFEDIHIPFPAENYTYLYYGENVHSFSAHKEICSSWISLTDKNGRFKQEYGKFVSMTSSVKIISFGFKSGIRYSVKLYAIKPRGKEHMLHQ